MLKFFGGFIPIYLKKAQVYDAITGGRYLLPKGKVAMITTTHITTLFARSINIKIKSEK